MERRAENKKRKLENSEDTRKNHFFYQLPSVVIRHMSRFLKERDIWILTRTFPLLLQDSIFKQKADWYEQNHLFRCIYCKSTRRKKHSCPIKWDFGDYLTEEHRTWSDQLALEFFERKIWGQEITDSVIRNFYILKSLYKSFYRFKGQ